MMRMNRIYILGKGIFMKNIIYSLLLLVGITCAMDETERATLSSEIRTMSKEDAVQEQAFRITVSLAAQVQSVEKEKNTFGGLLTNHSSSQRDSDGMDYTDGSRYLILNNMSSIECMHFTRSTNK